jgi:hypothetical protein
MGDFARRYAWILPVAFALLLAAVGWSSYRTLEQSMRGELGSRLETVRDATIAALVVWSDEVKAVVDVHAARPIVRESARDLAALALRTGDSREAFLASPILATLHKALESVTERHGFQSWGVVALNGTFLATRTGRNTGHRVPGIQASLDRMGAGETIVTPPTSVRLLDNQPVGLMVIGGPIKDESGKVIAILGFSLNPELIYGRLLVGGRLGETGETYAFDEEGVLVSRSRFEKELREVGLLPDDPSVPSYLYIHVRNPGGNVMEGFQPTLAALARPFTVAAASAVGGESGVDVEGYPDYRGVPVLGAWAWLPELGIGVASEIGVAEAYAGLYVLRGQFSIIVGVLGVGALGMFLYSFLAMSLGRQVAAARQLGRYSVERKLGRGGMGTVYLARHALLKRPAALKVLEGDAAGEEAVTRFEREVQTTGALRHPNTVELYDFGHTPDGAFYYAMEYVRGPTLQALVEHDGPQPDARVVHILRQAAGSIAEAHRAQIVHRDIKPSNIMLSERGGVFDFVKVLDFGLVRMSQQPADVALTGTQALTGSPLYMSPEALENPKELDARGDVYQLGAVAYYLMAGQPPFSGDDLIEVLAKHLKQDARPPSEVLGRAVSPELEALVMRCLRKDPGARARDAGELLADLEQLEISGSWTQAAAAVWWQRWTETHGESFDAAGGSGSSGTPSGWSIDLASRVGNRQGS